MIDHLVGRPNPSWKRAQVFLVILFWSWRIMRSGSGPPRFLWLTRANRSLKRFTPWQIILTTLTTVYAIRNFDRILGLSAPEPLARLYSPSYYRATWISTGLDAGFATAMSVRPKWLRDICSILFSFYYILYAHEADEKLRRFRAVPTVEMLRATWEKTTNPYLKLFMRLPSISLRRKLTLSRPSSSHYSRPISGFLYFAPRPEALSDAAELILDFPGGGFVAMTPEHHEERLRLWAINTRRPIFSIDYGKAPEYPYPFAIDEAFDTYKALMESAGRSIGMSGRPLRVIVTGDSAGAALAVNLIIRILEHNARQKTLNTVLPLPISVVLSYAALDFNFTSWMTPNNLRVLRSEQSTGNLPGLRGLAVQKDHLQHVSPLSMVSERRPKRSKRLRRKASWKNTLRSLTLTTTESTSMEPKEPPSAPPVLISHNPGSTLKRPSSFLSKSRTMSFYGDEKGSLADSESDEEEEEDFNRWNEEDRPIEARIRYDYQERGSPASAASSYQGPPLQSPPGSTPESTECHSADRGKTQQVIGTRLTMTSRTGYFQDRIVSPSMMRAMAILYIGPHRNPDFSTDYYISPILTPAHLLAQFPPLLMQCGEKDPFVDDTVIFAGRVREAKRARKIELELAISGKSARFGENSRTSGDRLADESEDDWVQMILFSDWSHGYLQMPGLMPEAKGVIIELAEWMGDTFKRRRESLGATSRMGSPAVVESPNGSRTTSTKGSLSASRQSEATSPLASETETDDPGITFSPKRHQDRPRPEGTAAVGDRGERNISLTPVPGRYNEAWSESGRTPSDGENETMSPSEATGQLLEIAVRSATPDTPKPTGQRQTGQTISETELMRRRRLLDSHIFE
ncbi:alpha/beta-hydrolase [Pluteus cervinus]|uniref:Alpha/beta-hydrolase n=1 Tax=Pluteus cervinus TaxID=181527 RepID=A0ACD3B8G1_9AGAR|nr:alpha/beta-hydrolase [Pluteus cervinus]